MKWADVRKLSGPVWFMVIGTMFSRTSFFVSMPYLALRLQGSLNLDPLEVGLTMGIGPLVGIFAGFYVGYLSDQWGRKSIFTASVLLSSLTFLGFAHATAIWHFAVLNTLIGLCNAAGHPVSAALISDLTPVAQRKSAYQLRYFAINLGATVGPVAGAWLLLKGPSLGFWVTSVVFLLFGLACLVWIPADAPRSDSTEDRATFTQTLRALSRDRPLLYYTLAFIFMGLTYSQLESTLPQQLKASFGDSGVRLYGLLMGVNAATVVIFQLPITWATSRLSLIGTVKLGSIIYGVGFLVWSFIGQGDWTYSIGMAILTLGEILIFSNGSLVIDQIAPEKNKGAYFGASGLWALGATVGPAMGGAILMRAGGPVMYACMGGLGILNAGVYELGRRAQKSSVC